MPLQLRTFSNLPSADSIRERLVMQRGRIADLTSYLWYLMPLAEKFGERVYEVAAQSLAADGVPATAQQLRKLAEELKTPDGLQRYAENRRLQLATVTSYKVEEGSLSPT